MTGGKERKTLSLDAEIVAELDEKSDNDSALVNRLLDEFFATGGTGPVGLEMRIRDLEERLDTALNERDRLNRRIERLRREKEQVEREIEAYRDEHEEQLREAAEYVRGKPPENPAVQNWAQKLGMQPVELLQQVEDLDEIEQ